MEFAAGLISGTGLVLLAMWLVGRRSTRLVFPEGLDTRLTFVIYDAEGNQLTQRVPMSLGPDGTNLQRLLAPAIREGVAHHAVLFVGEYGAVARVTEAHLKPGIAYSIDPGNWHTEITPEAPS